MEGITDFVSSIFRGNVLNRLSSQLGASPNAVERGIAQAVPLSMAGLAERAQSEQGANDLLARFRDGSYPQMDPSDLSDPDATRRMAQAGHGMANGLFGNRLGSMLDVVSGQSGLSRASSGTLIGLVVPVVLSWIGSHVKSRGLNAQGLSRLLSDESQKLSSFLPAGFGFGASRAGSGGIPGTRERVVEYERREPVHHTSRHVEASRGPVRPVGEERAHRPPERSRKGLAWLLAGLAALAALLVFWISRRGEQARVPEVEAPVATAPDDVDVPRVETPDIERTAGPEGAEAEGSFREGVSAAGRKLEEGAEAVRDKGAEIGESTREGVSAAGRELEEGAEAVRDKGAEIGESTREGVSETGREIEEGAEGVGAEGTEAERTAREEGRAQAPAGERSAEEAEEEGAREAPTAAGERQPVAGTDLTVLSGSAAALQQFFQNEEAPVPQRFVLEGLQFSTGEAAVTPDATLDAVAQTLAANSDARVRIEGHTDDQGSDEDNRALSQQRAEAVKDYLVQKGVSDDQLTAVGRSADSPIADNQTTTGRARNRRVELVITER